MPKPTLEETLNDWAASQPHSFFSYWPTASHTRCDWCRVYKKEHQPDVDPALDVAKHPTLATRPKPEVARARSIADQVRDRQVELGLGPDLGL